MDNTQYTIFKQGSKTYFYSSIFFPKKIRDDVFSLYSFVRKADDYVDSIPQQVTSFYDFKTRYLNALKGGPTGDVVIDSFVELSRRKDFDPTWVEAFFTSMEADLKINEYKTIEDLEKYLYGSAEVVGLMMAKLMGLPRGAYPCAQQLGRAMQYVNFIRDIAEDLTLNRTYFPKDEMEEYRLTSLDYETVSQHPLGFKKFIARQISRYTHWQKSSESGFSYIPRRYLIPIKTASEMYRWTANMIHRNPLIIYKIKVKPSIPNIIGRLGYNTIFTYRS